MTVKRWMLGLGTSLIVLLLLVMGIYVRQEEKRTIQPVAYPEKVQTDVTLEGYEESDDLLKYMIYQLGERNLDGALRGCAFQNIAECFCLDYYTEYLDRFENTNLIPPSDADSPAYLPISNARLAVEYAGALEQMMVDLQEGELKLLALEEDVPENPDGKYYELRTKVCEILGARSLDEKIVYLQVGDQTKELRCTLVRYRKYWKVLFFHPLEDTGVDVIDLQDSTFSGTDEINLEAYENDILPCNYYLLNNNSEEDPRTLIKRFFLYLQREDARAAMSYMDIYGTEKEAVLSVDWLERQAQAAHKIQEFYYRTLLYDTDYVKWISKDISERGSDFTKALSTTNMLFTQMTRLDEIQNDGQTAEYDFYWIYESVSLGAKVHLENRDGWKITEIEWM